MWKSQLGLTLLWDDILFSTFVTSQLLVVVLVSLEQIACPSRSHRVSMGLRSNYRQAISSSPLPCS